MSSKDLIRGFLLAHNAPQEILSALNAISAMQGDSPTPETLPDDIKSWQISMRTSNCLSNVGIDTLKKLMTLSESELLKIPNFGRKSLNELKYYIKPNTFPLHPIVKLDWEKNTNNPYGHDHYKYPNV